MKSKTLSLVARYKKYLKEQADPNSPEGEMPMEDPAAGGEAPPEAPEQEPEVLQLTGDAEDNYISMVIDAALFEPSSVNDDQRRSLLNMQEIMLNKSAAGVSNAREEVLPIVMSIISSQRDEPGFKKAINKVEPNA